MGTLIVYCADHPSSCVLETLVHADTGFFPEEYQLLEIEIPDDVGGETANLDTGWENDPDLTRGYWQAFCEENRGVVLEVPSVIIPQASNYLVNPRHEDMAKVSIIAIHKNRLDERLLLNFGD